MDIFTCDIADAALKSDMASMEHPVFALQTKDMSEAHYEHNGNQLSIFPSSKGRATIWDRDLLIFVISNIMAAKNRGENYSKKVEFSAYDFLIFSNRNAGGREYKLLRDALHRLNGTRLETTIKTGSIEQTDMFGLVDSTTVRRELSDGRVTDWAVTLSDWLFNAIEGNEVLSINEDYFRLRKALERRVYEIARKHCGAKKEWPIGLKLLQKKCGSKSPIRNFRKTITDFSKTQHLPDYYVYIEDDKVTFVRKEDSTVAKSPKTHALERFEWSYEHIPPLKAYTVSQFKQLYPDLACDTCESEWREWAKDKAKPQYPDKAFLKFAETWATRARSQQAFDF